MADPSAWFAKLEKLTPEQRQAIGWSDEDFALAKREHLQERDYTQKSQKVAALQKIQEQRPDLSWDQVLQVYDWYAQNAPTVKEALELHQRRDRLVERPEPSQRPAGEKVDWRNFDTADLWDRARALGIFEDLHASAQNAAYERFQKDWKEKELPRLDQTANGYAATILDVFETLMDDREAAAKDPKHLRISASELLKQGSLRGERDFRKVAAAWREEQANALKPVEEAAFQRGLEQGRKAQDGPSGPVGAQRLGWTPDKQDPTPKTADARFARVMQTLETKHGPLPV